MTQILRGRIYAAITALMLAGCSATPNSTLNDNDVEFLTGLGLMRGHLHVGMNLYRQGYDAQAASHMKHPSDELYTGLEAGLLRRGAPGFANELESLALRVEGKAGRAATEHAYSELLTAISQAEKSVNADNQPALNKAVIISLLEHAAEEYQIGIRNGEMHNMHEYQDAWGFTQVAATLAENAQDAMLIKRELETLAVLWPVLVPEGGALGDGKTIENVARRLSR